MGTSFPMDYPYSPSLRKPLPDAALDVLEALPGIRSLDLAYTRVTDTRW